MIFINKKMKKKLRLTETELTNLIKQVVIESNTKKRRISEGPENFFNPEALDTAEAIYTIIGTTIGMLGIAGYDILKQYAKELMNAGKKKEGREMMSAIKDMQSKGEQGGEIGEEIGGAGIGGRVRCKVNEKPCRGVCIKSSYYCCPDGRVEPPGNKGCYQEGGGTIYGSGGTV
jgi:hypothetical protein